MRAFRSWLAGLDPAGLSDRERIDLVAEIVALFRLLTGQQVMETRQALLSLAEAIA